jgi:3-methyladenine DNA glycosylase AlkC
MEKLKNIYSKAALQSMALEIAKHYPPFRADSFVDQTWKAIKDLEMKDRVRTISKQLHAHLPNNYESSIEILLNSIQTEKNPAGISGFLVWPFTQYIEDHGVEKLMESLNALKAITATMSAEFAVRPFIIKYQEKCLELFRDWAEEDNFHIRRLVSEGSRPRLPWGQKIPAFIHDPTLTMPLLKTLRHSEELYVRKSVANHLNDISKDHPKFLIKELTQWKKDYPDCKKIDWILRHSLRSLVKKGDTTALKLLGYSGADYQVKEFQLSPASIKFGNSLEFRLKVRAPKSQSWMIDYSIHHRKANGSTQPKVFKWKKSNVKKNETLEIRKLHPFRKISTRRYYEGKHFLEILINGVSVVKKSFELRMK